MKKTIIAAMLALVVSPQAITCRHNARMKKGHLYEISFPSTWKDLLEHVENRKSCTSFKVH